MAMVEATIYFKSGNSTKVNVDNLTVTKLPGQITKLEWEGLKKAQLLYIDLDQIECIMVKE